jgi:tetratricopeptide (TPR) repeat protein
LFSTLFQPAARLLPGFSLFRKFVAWTVCIVVALAASVATAQKLSPQQWTQLTREGYRLTPEQAASLEEALAKTPEDLEARARLMGFYFAPASQSLAMAARIHARRRHIIWLIATHPDSPLLNSSEATVNPTGQYLGDTEGYQAVQKAWMEAMAKNYDSPAVLGNAARFFYLSEKGLAADIYERARKLEPGNPVWLASQGSVLAFALVGISAVNQNGLPDAADPKEAASDAAKKIRRDMDATKDVDLLVAVAGELMNRGIMAQSIARNITKVTPAVDALTLAESFLRRAQQLDPEKPSAHLGLARAYELRAMLASSDEERKALAQSRYKQLVSGMSGLHQDDPARSQDVLTLARAAMEAGELERAQALAKSLLAMVPQLSADPKLKWSVDGIRHHSYLILGRVALRHDDLETAKADLLDAGRVGGGGTLASFGPNMSLAKELLEKGNKDVVLQYLELCAKFWMFPEKIEPWVAAIKKGEIPNFGRNLDY